MNVQPILSIQDLRVSFRTTEGILDAVDEVFVEVFEGEALGLVGESGSGKSTLALQCLGYQHSKALTIGGSVNLKGRILNDLSFDQLSELRGKQVSFVPQNPTTALNPAKRISQLFMDVVERHNVSRSSKAAEQLIVDLLSKVGLGDMDTILDRYPHQLSGGQQQRICIAIALICSPDLIVLDEPTTGLDVTTQEQIISLLIQLKSQLGLSMLYVTHDLALLSQIADRVAVMYAGQIVEIAQTERLFNKPLHPYTEGLIDSIPQVHSTEHATKGKQLKGFLRRTDLSMGCRFSARCDQVRDSCKSNRQNLVLVKDAHLVACERWDEVDSSSQSRGTVIDRPETEQIFGESNHRRQDSGPILEVNNLSVVYHGVVPRVLKLLTTPPPPAVADVSFQINRGRVFALVGESGSGKSTIARAIGGIIVPEQGAIRFEDKVVPALVGSRTRENRKNIQYIFQNPDASLNPRMRIGETIARQVEVLDGCESAKLRRRVEMVLSEVQLDGGYYYRYPDELSGGERQRVAIARALVVNPSLLLCDEILSGLDVSVQANVIEVLRQMVSERGVSILFISHDVAVVRELADEIGVLYKGRLLETGTKTEIFSEPYHPYTKMLLNAVPQVGRVPNEVVTEEIQDRPLEVTNSCVFSQRCKYCIEGLCDQSLPPLQKFGGSHYIRCHLDSSGLRNVQ